MGMGIVSDDDFHDEFSRLNGNQSDSKSNVTIEVIEKGRGKGNVEVPDSLRKVIGETSKIEGREEALELAKNFGISPSSVSAYANGSNSTASYDEQPNLGHINQAKERISKKARSRLLLALNSITKDKLENAKARDLAGVAKDMSAVVKNMEPDNAKNPNDKSGPTFVFYAPNFRKESDYEIVVAKE